MNKIVSQVQTRNSLIEDFSIFEQKTYLENETLFVEDPLVLACSLKELSKRNANSFYSLSSDEVSGNITQEIREHAEVVRKYYTKKFFWTNLTNSRMLSDFRSRVCFLLENRITKVKDQDQGIYFKIPWFYDEDMIYENFKKTLRVDTIASLGNARHNKMIKRLEFLKTSFSWQRKRKITRYWFKDDNQFLYGIELESDNPLLEMFDQYLKDNPVPVLETYLKEDRIDNMNFYKLYQFKFLKEQHA